MHRIILFVIISAGFLFAAGLSSAALPPIVAPLTPVGDGLATPARLAFDRFGVIHVADPRQGGIVRLTLDGLPTPLQPLIKTDLPPLGVAVAPNDDLLVTQGESVALFRRKSDGTFEKIATLAPPDGFGTANGIAVAADGTVFVVDSGKHRVVRFSSSYDYISTFGSQGNGNGQFNLPTAIAYDRSARQILVVDTLNGRIQFFDANGTFIRSIGRRGPDLNGSDDTTDPGLFFTSPQGIALEYSRTLPETLERIYVVDTYQSRVQVVDPTGTGSRLRYIGAYGTTKGKLLYPADIIFDPYNSRIIVSNGMGNLIPFGIDGGVTPPVDTPPILSVSPLNTPIRNSSFTLSGSVDRPSIVEVSVIGGSASVAPVTFTTTTSWSTTISGLSEGSLTSFRVTARSIGGSSSSKSFDITYLPNAPILTITPPPSTATVTDSITIGGTTGEGTVITVTGPIGTESQITRNGTTWSARVTGLRPGENDLEVTATENNLSTSSRVTITRGDLSLYTLPDQSATPNPFQTIAGRIDSVTEINLSLNGSPPRSVPVTNGYFSTAVMLSRGENTLTLTARDLNGNELSRTIKLTHDPSLPPLTIDPVTVGDTRYGTGTTIPTGGTATISGSHGGGTVTATLDGTDLSITTTETGWSATLPPLTPGAHTVLVTLSSNGQTSREILPFLVVNQNDAPPLSLTVNPEGNPDRISFSDLATNRNRLIVGGVTAPGTTVSVDVSLNGTSLPVELDRATGRFTLPIPVELQPSEGVQTLVVTAYGTNGSTTTLTRTIFHQTTQPTMTTRQNDGQIVFTLGSGYVEARYIDGNGVIQRLPIAPDGTVTIPAGGVEQKSITFIDVAGNTSRNGRLTPGNGEPTLSDVLKAIRVSVGLDTPTQDQLLTGDVAPLVNGTPSPDGTIDARDALAILYRIVGTFVW